MKEEFLHYVWRTKNFARTSLQTTAGQTVRIIDFGVINREGGPDFQGCRIEIGDTTWVGNVEMHLVSSDWRRHGHHSDLKYNNVILHVVMEDDEPVFIASKRLPCLEMKGLISGKLLAQYARLAIQEGPVACSALIEDVRSITKARWLDRMMVERLESRVAYFYELRNSNANDWEEVLYVALARSFGFRSNSDAFERLARAVSLKAIRVSSSSLLDVEAMLFGAAGMLNRIFSDAYANDLQRRFNHFEKKFGIVPLSAHVWQWGSLRPANFPTLRIAQFCALLYRHRHLVGTLLDARSVADLREILNVGASGYWNDHTDFDKTSKSRNGQLGSSSSDIIIINTLLPFLFIYGTYRASAGIRDKVLEMYMQLSPENNYITRQWAGIGMLNEHAGHSQGLIWLKRQYCDYLACTDCAIGHEILGMGGKGHDG